MALKPEFPPLLSPGFRQMSDVELRQVTVDAFTSSATRAPLWSSFSQLISELQGYGLVPFKLWVDGSFLTEKIDPDDVDIVVEIDSDKINAASAAAQDFLLRLSRHELHPAPRKLHTFIVPSAPLGHPDRINYMAISKRWEHDFGHALVSGDPKGIAILEVAS